MGIVWEAYHNGVPLLGVPGNPTESNNIYTAWKVHVAT